MSAEVTGKGLVVEIKDNMVVEVLTLTNQLTFVGRVERYSNDSLTIREAAGGELPPVLYNKEIKLRMFQPGGQVVLRGKICGSTRYLWKVDRLESQFAEEKRMFFRQHVNLDASAKCIRRVDESAAAVEVKWGKLKPGQCQVLDVSAGGLMIRSRDVFQLGDQIQISDVSIVREERPFEFLCRVRRVRENPGDREYGLQFEGLPLKEQDRLLRAIFIAQRKDIQRRNGDD